MKKLYYTVKKETATISGTETCTGMKTISVYEIALDKPHLWFNVECSNDTDPKDAINGYLNDNGFGDRVYELIEL